jgi:hypothetical protein
LLGSQEEGTLMKRITLLVFVVVLGCNASDSTKKGPSSGGATTPPAAGSSSLEEIKEQACACKDQDCVDRVTAELGIERRRFEKAMDEAVSCLTTVEGADGADPILTKMRAFKDKVCSCRDKSCVVRVETEMVEWAMKNMDQMKNMKPTKAQDEAADRIEDEMEKCKEALEIAPPR